MLCLMPRVGLPDYLLTQLNNSETGTINSTHGPGVAVYCALDNSSCADIFLEFNMDGEIHFENRPIKRKRDTYSQNSPLEQPKMQFSTSPEVFCKTDEVHFDPSKDGTLSINVSDVHVLLQRKPVYKLSKSRW